MNCRFEPPLCAVLALCVMGPQITLAAPADADPHGEPVAPILLERVVVTGRRIAVHEQDSAQRINLDQIERIEVLKGPASALYGAQAMGGVVNLISRESRGAIEGAGELGLGQFDTREVKGRIGGRVDERWDFDYAGSWYGQDDFRMGNGQQRPNTAYQQYHHALRLGLNLQPARRLLRPLDRLHDVTRRRPNSSYFC